MTLNRAMYSLLQPKLAISTAVGTRTVRAYFFVPVVHWKGRRLVLFLKLRKFLLILCDECSHQTLFVFCLQCNKAHGVELFLTIR
jgi:hypothetical protein